jgi:galactokinase
LIGEHTDYNDGYVLPAAINKSVYLAIEKRDDHEIHLFSTEYKEHYVSSLDCYACTQKHWPNYIIGVTYQLLQQGYSLTGFNVVIGGDIPIGSGVASSAAFACAAVFGLNEIFHLGVPKTVMIRSRGDMPSVGKKMFKTHEDLSRLYEVSCKELDFSVAHVKNEKSVLGARMMGGGFGGCTIKLVYEDAIPDLTANISNEYSAAFGLELKPYIMERGDGISVC